MSRTLQEQLDRVLDDFREWKAIYGDPSPGYIEPNDQKKERERFKKTILHLRAAITKAEGRD